ncbi:GNAT family N-acetyltransferase [Yoonia litorea]|uniref:Protein N-acetyltransferase, RimJ/RimL family n=1 Tax=Yoonia litorea TaxID=1123755 RepID=A0A1I6M5Z2_9RHOB|nr:GNAT family N-acetyltransferase [Yoonia litorea]SFS11130.1 Protein N-acetyltransferase, RimJ/RimL family [Yoonia litorea]
MTSLTYRDIRDDDFDALHEMMTDWDVVRQLGGWPWPADPDFARSRCRPYEGDGFVWGIALNDRLIGTVGVTNGDMGYVLDPRHHGRGIISKAARDAVAHAFATTDRSHLTGSTWFDNQASYRVLQKLGFRHWQTRYIHAKARGRPTLVFNQRLERADWDRLRSQSQ